MMLSLHRLTRSLARAATLVVTLALGAGDCGPDNGGSPGPGLCATQDCGGHGTCVEAVGVARCTCMPGYVEVEGPSCVQGGGTPAAPCDGVSCSGHGVCQVTGSLAACRCEAGYFASGLSCVVESSDPCAGVACSGHGACSAWNGVAVCACAAGYTPSTTSGLDCAPTVQVCRGGAIDYDVNGDGSNESWFEPSADECAMYELINAVRASHDDGGSPECHTPLAYSVGWSAHGRRHSTDMAIQRQLFHADFPRAQNVAMGCDAACEMDNYMHGADEGHCDALSHHCNIMRCGITAVGVGTYLGSWNTQNFE